MEKGILRKYLGERRSEPGVYLGKEHCRQQEGRCKSPVVRSMPGCPRINKEVSEARAELGKTPVTGDENTEEQVPNLVGPLGHCEDFGFYSEMGAPRRVNMLALTCFI